MTVEEYLRSLVPGLDLQDNVVERCALSPVEVGLEALEIDDEVDADALADVDFRMRLDYASSTIYYSVLGVFAGGGYAEQVGDVRASRGGYTITMADRARFKSMADALRIKWGWETDDSESDGGMYDATYQTRPCYS